MRSLDVRLDDIPTGSMRDGVYALDHACPHEGYGLTQGTLDGNLLTCAWRHTQRA